MTQNRSFKRKLLYIGLLIVLLLPLSYLGQPSRFTQGQNVQADERDFQGYLSKLRDEHELSQTSIGDIDPSGATMQYLLFGFNGVAVNKLWNQAQESAEERRLGNAAVDAGTTGEVAAPLLQSVGLSGAQPDLQYVGRVRRLPRPV
ncbi:MAG: hypothetical protein QM811_01810 [Pirellulales bacterium]